VRRTALALVICLAVMAARHADCADGATEQEAQGLYAQALNVALTPGERISILEQVAKDYADTRWADDALWVLGEMAHGSGDTRRAILFRRQLLERDSPPCLEAFTRSQRVYARSRVPHVLFVLERTGHLYRTEGRQAVQFNPLPMITCEELALAYEDMGLLELALRDYRRAIAAAPPGDLYARLYARRAERLERKIALLHSSSQPPAGAGEAGGAEQGPPEERPPQDTGAKADEQGEQREESAGGAAGR